MARAYLNELNRFKLSIVNYNVLQKDLTHITRKLTTNTKM